MSPHKALRVRSTGNMHLVTCVAYTSPAMASWQACWLPRTHLSRKRAEMAYVPFLTDRSLVLSVLLEFLAAVNITAEPPVTISFSTRTSTLAEVACGVWEARQRGVPGVLRLYDTSRLQARAGSRLSWGSPLDLCPVRRVPQLGRAASLTADSIRRKVLAVGMVTFLPLLHFAVMVILTGGCFGDLAGPLGQNSMLSVQLDQSAAGVGHVGWSVNHWAGLRSELTGGRAGWHATGAQGVPMQLTQGRGWRVQAALTGAVQCERQAEGRRL